LPQPEERDRHHDVDRADPARGQHQPRLVLDFPRRPRRPDLRTFGAYGRGGGGGDRACDPGGLFPQPRIDRGRGHQHHEGLSWMYQAIVFLPLFGAVVAGLIALAGARARHPGGSPEQGAENHAAPLVHEDSAHAAPSGHGDVSAIQHDHAETHEAAPPAAGSRVAELITTSLLFIAMILSWIAFVTIGFGQDTRVQLLPWIVSGDLKVDWALRVDTLTAVMLVVVTTVSSFVHLYSIGYMEEDP